MDEDAMSRSETNKRHVKPTLGLMLLSFVILVVVSFAYGWVSGPAVPPTPKVCTVENFGTDAYIMAQFEVKDRLNDPGSARFSHRPDQINVDTETCVFSIRTEFFAKNGFGGRIRSVFVARMMRHEDDSWSTLYLDVQ